MAAKMSFFANEAIFSCKVAYLIGFDLLRTKICGLTHFRAKNLPTFQLSGVDRSEYFDDPKRTFATAGRLEN